MAGGAPLATFLIGSCSWVPHPLVSKGAVLDLTFAFFRPYLTSTSIPIRLQPTVVASRAGKSKRDYFACPKTEEPHPCKPKGAAPKTHPKSLLDNLHQWYHASVRGIAGKKKSNRGSRVRHPPYAKIDGSMDYSDAHDTAMARENRLRNERPSLTKYNPGSGPGDSYDITGLIKH